MPKKPGKEKEFSKLAPIEAKGAAFKNAQQLFGHVTLVQSYAVLSGDTGYCLVRLRDQPNKTVAVFTDEPHMYGTMRTGLETGNLVSFVGELLTNPPTPTGGTWAVDVYSPTSFAVYSFV
jgi:hypothetical protein